MHFIISSFYPPPFCLTTFLSFTEQIVNLLFVCYRIIILNFRPNFGSKIIAPSNTKWHPVFYSRFFISGRNTSLPYTPCHIFKSRRKTHMLYQELFIDFDLLQLSVWVIIFLKSQYCRSNSNWKHPFAVSCKGIPCKGLLLSSTNKIIYSLTHAYVALSLLCLAIQARKICSVFTTTFSNKERWRISFRWFIMVFPRVSLLIPLILWGVVFL
jgi:hypothetical protein